MREINRRIEWIDLAKGVTIFFVILFHAFMSVYNANAFSSLYQSISEWGIFLTGTFIMPVFFALSGGVYKRVATWQEYTSKLLKQLIVLGIPYVLFSCIYVTLQNISPGNTNYGAHSFSSLLYIFVQPISYVWYLYALYLIYILVGVLDLLSLNVRIQFYVSIALFFVVQYVNIPHFLWYPCTWVITFTLGRLITSYSSLLDTKIAVSAFVILIVAMSWQVSNGNSLWFNTNDLVLANAISKLASIFVFFYIYSHMQGYSIGRYFIKYGRDSLIVYLIHAPVVSALRALLIKAGISYYVLLISLVVILTWLISIGFCHIARKVKVVNAIFYPFGYIVDFLKFRQFNKTTS